jgi:hypothetical protein
MVAGLHRRRNGTHRIQELRSGDKDDAGAGQGQDQAHRPRIQFDIMARAFDRADSDRISYQPRFGARLDGEQASDFAQLAHS